MNLRRRVAVTAIAACLILGMAAGCARQYRVAVMRPSVNSAVLDANVRCNGRLASDGTFEFEMIETRRTLFDQMTAGMRGLWSTAAPIAAGAASRSDAGATVITGAGQ